jgi:hypothetical protein
MTCSQPTGTTQGILIAYGPGDTGDRPLAAGIPFWATPNIRLALQADLANLSNPATWDTPQYANWNGQVEISSAYNLLVRVRNTDPSQQRASLNLQGWVSDYTMGGVGPGSAILLDPAQPPGPSNPPVSFNGFNNGPLGTADTANPSDPASMLVLVSNEQWVPNANQLAVNGGHVCTAVNVWADATGNGTTTPVDGSILASNFLDATCDRMYGQRNVQIVTAPQGQHIQIPAMILVPATDRCPLRAAVAIRPVELKEGQGGGLLDVPELSRAASDHAIAQLHRPEGDPRRYVWCGPGDGDHDHDHDGEPLKVNLEPGERADLKVNLDARSQRPGDAYALDLITTDTATGRLFGAARMLVLVTD